MDATASLPNPNMFKHTGLPALFHLPVIKPWLYKLNIPVAEFLNKFKPRKSNAQLILSMFSVTSLARLFTLLSIHLSAVVNLSGSPLKIQALRQSSSAQILMRSKSCWQNSADSTFSSENLKSFPGGSLQGQISMHRYHIYLLPQGGSMLLPKDLLIFFLGILTMPWINTWPKGSFLSQDGEYVRTQKNIISYPVTSISVG